MSDDREKKVRQLRRMLDQAQRTIEQDEPDLVIFDKLIAGILDLARELREPANPYADRALRPGMSVQEAEDG